MDGRTADVDGSRDWVLAVSPPRRWRGLPRELARVLGRPVLEVEGADAAQAALGRACPIAALLFAESGLRGRDPLVGRLKAVRPGVPVLVLLAEGRHRPLLNALEMGADDAVRLPLAAGELALRLRATLRRLRDQEPAGLDGDQPLRVGALALDLAGRRARWADRTLRLTDTEFHLLAMLATGAGQPLSRERLLNQVCGFDYEIDSRVIDVHVRNLRKKVEPDPARPVLIRAVPGVGYCVPVASDQVGG